MNVDPIRQITEEERVVAISLLRRAAERGRVSSQELERRLTAARRARLVGGLASALADIDHSPFDAPSIEWPVLPSPPPAAVAGPSWPSSSVTVGYQPEEPLTVVGNLQSERLAGAWIVPLYLRLHAALSSVRVDCRRAHPAASTIDVEIRAGLTTIVMVLPGGWAADARGLGRDLGTLRVKVPQDAAGGCPVVRLHGRLGITTLIVRGENRVDRWRDPHDG